MIRFQFAESPMLANFVRASLLAIPSLAIGLATARAQNINEPEVEKGQTKLETFHEFQSGFNGGAAGATRELHTFNYYRGLTDFWMVKATLAIERPEDESYRTTAAIIENTFEFVNAKKSGGLGLAWWTGLGVGLNEEQTNAVAFGPIVRIGAGPTSLILNPFLEKTFGRNREEGIAFIYGWQVKHEVRKGFWLGVEGFGKLPDIGGSGGPEQHRIGPLLTFEIETAEKRSLAFEFGVLFGLTEATPDTAVKAQVTFTFGG
jgi:hypothetical protein